ncbi:hypothetical protein TBR22_A01020 [Luteitalea sp. TBR-22]|uniref:DUF481 domain-containing protein n=1 Tax=Luteitalea sp. TBR-22 TaxID=2802971 RepID=UPI001AF704F0|nr:DUF481 domain-containing protein [Luteitalea sp. TBR-22]BCS30901.1 hypothetical protein TBR22_A01020 [Luteitalea sp. TBR-22]
MRPAQVLIAAAFALAVAVSVSGQPKTDVVTLANGDRLTGEVKLLDRGRLEFSTDDAGTLYLEWDKLTSVVAGMRVVEVVTEDGRRYLGRLVPAVPRSLAVGGSEGVVVLSMTEVTIIRPIGASFWAKLDGSFDAGFNYTQSSGIAQLNVNSDTLYRKFGSQVRLTASLTATATDDDDGRDDRALLELSYLRYPWREWFVAGAGRIESNESLGVQLRSQIGVMTGPRLINSNRGHLSIGAGVVLNDEVGVDVERVQNVEGVFVFDAEFFTYDRPRTTLDVNVQYYPSLSNAGRHRLSLNAGAKRELFKDLFVAVNVYNSYDNRPPNPAAERNDIGVVLSVGWTY